ncbi:MAG: hypothetical protein ACK56F_32820, partial [bacterium]
MARWRHRAMNGSLAPCGLYHTTQIKDARITTRRSVALKRNSITSGVGFARTGDWQVPQEVEAEVFRTLSANRMQQALLVLEEGQG